jgi:hypothetical protein
VDVAKELSLIYFFDLIRAMFKASCSSKHKGSSFFVTDIHVYAWKQITEECAQIMNIQVKTLKVPETLLIPGALFLEVLAQFISKPALFDRPRIIYIR